MSDAAQRARGWLTTARNPDGSWGYFVGRAGSAEPTLLAVAAGFDPPRAWLARDLSWGALLAPAGTPPEIVARVQAEVAKIFAMPDVRQKVEELGALPGGGSSAELDAFSRAELRKWAKVIKDGNIKPE